MSRSFNGTSDSGHTGSPALTATDNLSFGGWAITGNTAQINAVPFFNGATNNGYGVNYNGGAWQLFIGNVNFATAFTPAANVWFHFLAVRSGTWTLYADGSQVATSALVPSTPTTSNLFGASDGGASRWFSGSLAEWACWDAALSADEAKALGLRRLPYRTRPANLKGYWPLFGLQSPEPDLSGFARAVTLTGTVFAPHAPVTPFTRRAVNVTVILPEAPTGLTVTPSPGSNLLSWSSTTPDPVTFSIYRGTSPGSETLLDSGIAATSYTDGDVVPGTTYYYQVSGTDPGGEGALSAEASATASAITAPANLVATPGPGQVTLTWGAVAGATSYDVLRSTARSTGSLSLTNPAPNEYVTVPGLPVVAGPFTLAFWLNYGSLAGTQYLYAQGAVAAERLEIHAFGSGRPHLTSGTLDFVGNTPIATGAWHHVAVTYDGTVGLAYLDGVVDSPPVFGTPDFSGTVARLGNPLSSNLGITGGLDDFRVYGSALSADNVAALFAGLDVAGATHRWTFNEGTGTTAADTGGTGGLAGTLTGGAGWSTDVPDPVSFLVIANVLDPSYTDTAVSPGVTYYYKVRALIGAAEGSLSAEASATVPPRTAPTFLVFGYDLSAGAGAVMTYPDWSYSVQPLSPPVMAEEAVSASQEEASVIIEASNVVYDFEAPPGPAGGAPF